MPVFRHRAYVLLFLFSSPERFAYREGRVSKWEGYKYIHISAYTRLHYCICKARLSEKEGNTVAWVICPNVGEMKLERKKAEREGREPHDHDHQTFLHTEKFGFKMKHVQPKPIGFFGAQFFFEILNITRVKAWHDLFYHLTLETIRSHPFLSPPRNCVHSWRDDEAGWMRDGKDASNCTYVTRKMRRNMYKAAPRMWSISMYPHSI